MRMRERFALGLAFLLALLLLSDWSRLQGQSAKRPFQVHCYGTVNGVADALNQLSMFDVADTKIVVAPSSRNYFGVLGDPYCLIGRW